MLDNAEDAYMPVDLILGEFSREKIQYHILDALLECWTIDADGAYACRPDSSWGRLRMTLIVVYLWQMILPREYMDFGVY
jgi:hypothetical protein